MASIRRKKNGGYEATVYLGRDASGKVLRKSISRRTMSAAKEAARILEQQIAHKGLNDIELQPLGAYLTVWNDANCPQLAPLTVRAYKMYASHHIQPASIGSIPIGQITPLHVQKYFSDKLKEGLTTNTLRRHYFYLSRALREALKDRSPMLEVKAPKLVSYTPVVLTDDGFNRLWSKLHGGSMELPFLLGAWCGLRLGEIAALRWNDLSIAEDGHLDIRIDESLSLTEDGSSYIFKSPKSAKGARTVAAPDAIKLLLESREAGAPEDRIFTVRADAIGKHFHRIISRHNEHSEEDNKLPEIRFHDLRHYHATALWKNSFSAMYSAARLGHDIAVMQKIYTHMDKEYLKQADAKIASLFSSTSPSEQHPNSGDKMQKHEDQK